MTSLVELTNVIEITKVIEITNTITNLHTITNVLDKIDIVSVETNWWSVLFQIIQIFGTIATVCIGWKVYKNWGVDKIIQLHINIREKLDTFKNGKQDEKKGIAIVDYIFCGYYTFQSL